MGAFIFSAGALAIAVVCGVLAIVASGANVYLHLYHFRFPELQRPIIRIIIIVPVYALGSVLSLALRDQEPYFVVVRDIYEAFVVYSFLHLILEYIGGEGVCVMKLQEECEMRHPWPLCKLPPIHLNDRFITRCKQYTLQFVFVKPVMAAISVIMLATGRYESLGYQVFSLFVYNLSYSAALYALFLFYLATRKLLKGFHPVAKFFAVKTIVFATYWQSLVIRTFPGDREKSDAWNNLILCIEMLLFAAIHWFAFGYSEFTPGGSALKAVSTAAVENTSSKAAQPVSVGPMSRKKKYQELDNSEGSTPRSSRSMSENVNEDASFAGSNRALVLSRAKQVLSYGDVMTEAVHNFHPAYRRYQSVWNVDEHQLSNSSFSEEELSLDEGKEQETRRPTNALQAISTAPTGITRPASRSLPPEMDMSRDDEFHDIVIDSTEPK
eukprot:gb/GECG01013268.1/.p1 GENE.gb/GECG01013268.1/~~gb/GECG01013268.1/.p1  ORF type:complete len:439 (+),score=36.26 gb/GECG01013268.1/:1-1317(+)